MPINTDQKCVIDLNADQCRSILLNTSQCRSLRGISDGCIFFSIDRHWELGIDQGSPDIVYYQQDSPNQCPMPINTTEICIVNSNPDQSGFFYQYHSFDQY